MIRTDLIVKFPTSSLSSLVAFSIAFPVLSSMDLTLETFCYRRSRFTFSLHVLHLRVYSQTKVSYFTFITFSPLLSAISRHSFLCIYKVLHYRNISRFFEHLNRLKVVPTMTQSKRLQEACIATIQYQNGPQRIICD